MSDRARVSSRVTVGSNQHEFVDKGSHERVMILSQMQYREDFIAAGKLVIPAAGSAESGMDWAKKIVGAAPPTVAGVASAIGGQVSCTLTSTSEKQDALLYWNDQKGLDVTKGLIIEIIANVAVLPSAAGVQAIWGIGSNWIDGPDNNTCYLEFGCTANGAVLVRSYDGVTQNSISSGVTVVAGVAHVYRIDASDVTDVKFYIDGVQVTANGAVNFAATGTLAVLQPHLGAYKPSGTGVATLTADCFKAWMNRS